MTDAHDTLRSFVPGESAARGVEEGALPSAEAKRIVIEGYALASHAYRGDTFELRGSGYAHWLSRVTPGLVAGARVLDLGCGCGVPVAAELATRFTVTGVDLSPLQIERAKALVPGARFVCADMSEVAFEPESFDAIVAFHSIINLPLDEQPALIASMARWLAPGGRVLATVGHDAWAGIESDWRGVKGARMYYAHATVTRYLEWFAAAGLDVFERGREPKHGDPGYAVLIARKGGA